MGTAPVYTRKFQPSFYVDAYNLAREGKTDKQIADGLRPKAKYTAFVYWKRKDKAFARAIRKGRDERKPLTAIQRVTNPKQMAYLIAYAECGTARTAASVSGTGKQNHYHWMRDSEVYRDAFAAAKQQFAESLLDEAVRRGRDGVRRYQFHQGKPVMIDCPATHPEAVKTEDKNGNTIYQRHFYELEYSNPVLIKLLQAKLPECREAKDQTNVNVGIGGDVIAAAVEAAENARSKILTPKRIEQFAQQTIDAESYSVVETDDAK